MFQIEDCCYVVLEKDGEEVRRLFRVDSPTLLPRVMPDGASLNGLRFTLICRPDKAQAPHPAAE
jgi:hypothetical protein